MFKFGLDPGLRAVNTSLRGVRGADGHIQCGVGVAQSRGEDVSRPQIRPRNEAGYLHLRGVITLLRSCVNERRDSAGMVVKPLRGHLLHQ